MGRLDVNYFFINIPIEETIQIRINTIFENNKKVKGLSKIEFKEVLSFAIKESYFILNRKLYKLVYGATMGSPLG